MLFFQNRFQTAFEHYITPEILSDGIIFFGCITFALVLFTYAYLGTKKRSFFFRERIKKNMELWISNVILDEDDAGITIPEKFRKLFRNATARQYAIENLIANKKTFSGSVAENIRHLYEELGFKNDSLKKLNSPFWWIQAKGVQELAIMDQNDQLIKVYRLTNSKNEFVRSEAQNAILRWSGFNGLRFLDIVSYTISEWQQVQLLVQLRSFSQQNMPKMPQWLQSSNSSVVIFALKLCDVYQQFHLKSQVEDCLSHSEELVRQQAIRTLSRIGDEDSAKQMVAAYSNEHFTNQLLILQHISPIASENQIDFLLEQLNDQNDFLKLAAARALGAMGRIDLLKAQAAQQPEPYQKIFQHIQAEQLL